VAVTSGLRQMLNKNELEGVIAHELSHIGNKDILISTIIVILVGFVALMSDFFIRAQFFRGRRDNREGEAAKREFRSLHRSSPESSSTLSGCRAPDESTATSFSHGLLPA